MGPEKYKSLVEALENRVLIIFPSAESGSDIEDTFRETIYRSESERYFSQRRMQDLLEDTAKYRSSQILNNFYNTGMLCQFRVVEKYEVLSSFKSVVFQPEQKNAHHLLKTESVK